MTFGALPTVRRNTGIAAITLRQCTATPVHRREPGDLRFPFRQQRKRLTLRSALSAKLRDGELKVVDAFTFGDHKSKGVRAALTALEANKTVLMVDNGENRNLTLGARNLDGVTLMASVFGSPGLIQCATSSSWALCMPTIWVLPATWWPFSQTSAR